MTTALLDFSKPHVLRDDLEYEAAVAEIERLLDADVESGTEGYDRLEFLSLLVEHYEDGQYPMGTVTPQQAVTFMLEQKGLDRSDLDPVMVSTIGEPPLPADVLIGHARIQETQIIKQPDVLMLHHLVPTMMRPGTLSSDLDFYLPRTAHGSSLSPAITAANLARAGRPDEAIVWFELAARLDLDNLGGTTGGGVHLATMGGLWQALTRGFLGIRPGPDGLLIDPHLPAKWGPIRQRCRYRDAPICVEASTEDLVISSPHPVQIQLASGESAMHHRHHVRRSPSGWEFR